MTNTKLKSLAQKIQINEEHIINISDSIYVKDLSNLLYSIYVTQKVDYQKHIKEFHIGKLNFIMLINVINKDIPDLKNKKTLNSHIKMLGSIVKFNDNIKNNQIKYYI